MKTLVVYNNKGQLVFTQTNATDSYDLIVEDVSEYKEVIGVDISTGKCMGSFFCLYKGNRES